MARTWTSEGQEPRSEAIRLRQARWSQAGISKALGMPQKTLSNWLIMAKSKTNTAQPLSFVAKHSSIRASYNNRSPISLFPCKYEDVEGWHAPKI